MNKITLTTIGYEDCTMGRLWCNGFSCFTLELPYLDNARYISCIPEGEYGYFYRESKKNGRVLQLEGVPDRTAIQIHTGNFTRQIEGCILVGRSITYLDNDAIPDVTHSQDTMVRLLTAAGDRGIIEVKRYG